MEEMEHPMTENQLVPSVESTEKIQAINRDTVHRICSGQVVLSLAIAVKELVENAIDAGATIIVIHLKEYGSELIEVTDNGRGIMKENFQALTLKHYTSKIRQFSDLEHIATLGFRGEALSSLCALSDLTVLTKHEWAELATKITYDRNGKIVDESLGAREQGTTVTLKSLFSTLPVRRKEFVKNLKREFNKMCQLLYAYCLVSKGIKFSCSNTTNKGSKNTVVATDGLSTVRENIINVFGAKQISSLIDITIARPEEPILGEYGIRFAEGDPLPFTFEFLISSAIHGCGRSTNDRQFYYVNSRPCEPSKIMKLVNEIYRQYNNSQYPFVYLNITSKSSLVDVNVTPDKRQVFLENEKMLLATIKASMLEAFKVFPSTFKIENVEVSQNTTLNSFYESTITFKENKTKGLKRNATDGSIKKGSILERFQKRSKTENDKDGYNSPDLNASRNSSMEFDESVIKEVDEKMENFVKVACRLTQFMKTDEKVLSLDAVKQSDGISELQSSKVQDVTRTNAILEIENNEDRASPKPYELNDSNIVNEIKQSPKTVNSITKDEEPSLQNHYSDMDEDVDIFLDSSVGIPSDRKSLTLNVSLGDIRESLRREGENKKKRDAIKVRFRSKIAPESNKLAEEELQKQISKSDFKEMTILGQFNLGFIITKLKNDLFIVDQHASDEKYNFEDLQANTVLENQVLVNPKVLELTAGNESLLIENEEVFRKNGFSFKIDHSAPCTKKVSLTSIPMSKNYIFGKDDIDEMLFMLQETNNPTCRPSRIRSMFASRACRKSVMIGKALSKADMRKLIDHMGEINQPWNCPHGRPTMRHLINLDLIQGE